MDDGNIDEATAENNEEQMSDSSDSEMNEVPQQIETQASESESNVEEPEAFSDSQDDRTPNALRNIDGPEWKAPQGNQPVLIPFTKESGVNKNLSELLIVEEPLGFYSALVYDGIFQYIVDQTNLYATQTLTNEKDVTPHARVNDWFPTDIYEMKRFFGLVIYMGIVRLPKLADFWSREPMFKTEFASAAMPRNRFQLLLNMVHFADNENNPQNDRLHKLQSLVDMVVHNFQTVLEPGETICIDESLIPFRGRLVMRQYLKGKRHKYDIKIFKLCCNEGYTYNIQIYAGKNIDQQQTTPTRVVMKLAEPLLDCGRTMITDNWYTSLSLAEQLLDRQTHLIGTLRKNRKENPRTVTEKKLKPGECFAGENHKGITILSWRDKRYVLMLSTKHSDSQTEVRNRRGQTKKKPEVVLAYNKGKSPVDKSDQITAYQSPLRKTIKWYRKLAFEILLNTAIVNAGLMYKEVKHENISILAFRKSVAYGLCSVRPPPAEEIETVMPNMLRNCEKNAWLACSKEPEEDSNLL
ncbi:piggyBac transposable element-derived protein 4-like [Onthophagus taurus]|uniref:piggyBac transposable element-derived protein 4-like n=1 Tax=Onthophagus taurus TaxID=166361 RepID=UPI0039BE7407